MGETKKLTNVNAMPAPTWSWLKMNAAEVEVPAGLAPARDAVSVEPAPGSENVVTGNVEAFDTEMVAASKRYAARSRAAAPGDAAERAKLAAGELNTMDVPALSAYQRGAVRAEEELSAAEAFLTGCGREAYAYLRGLSGKPSVIDVPGGVRAAVTVRVDGRPGAAAAASLDVVVRANATLDLTLALDGAADPDAVAGVVGFAARVFAARGARVNVASVQTADDAFLVIDDMGVFADEGARVEVSHTVLGAGRS